MMMPASYSTEQFNIECSMFTEQKPDSHRNKNEQDCDSQLKGNHSSIVTTKQECVDHEESEESVKILKPSTDRVNKKNNDDKRIKENSHQQRCYTELGIRNIASLFVYLSNDVTRQKRKSQKHSIHILNLLISRQMQKRKIEALYSWRTATLTPPLFTSDSNTNSSQEQNSPKFQHLEKDQAPNFLLNKSMDAKLNPCKNGTTMKASRSSDFNTILSASTSTPVNLLVENLSSRTSNLIKLFDR